MRTEHTEREGGWAEGQEASLQALRISDLLGLDPEGTGTIKGPKEVSDPREDFEKISLATTSGASGCSGQFCGRRFRVRCQEITPGN